MAFISFRNCIYKGCKLSLLLFLFIITSCFRNYSALSIVAGCHSHHSCVWRTDNGVKCWGYNGNGQLGYGDGKSRGDALNEMGDDLLEIDLGSGFIPTQIGIGLYRSCALSTNNTVKCWGYNGHGQLGYGDGKQRGDGPDEMGDNLLTVDLGSGFIPTQISCGTLHSCALSANNSVKCWGHGLYGQLGYGNPSDRGLSATHMGDNLLEVDLGSGFIPAQVISGYFHTCALSTNNTLKCWGDNRYGQLGYGNTNNRGDGANEMGNNLLEVDLGSGFIPTQIVLGHYHTCALSANNTIKCWGWNAEGELGYEDTDRRGNGPDEMGDNLLTIDLGSGFIPTQIGLGTYHTCALSANNTVKCWGDNRYGQLGYGDKEDRGGGPDEMGDNLSEVDLGSEFIPTQIVLGHFHSCALSTNNGVKCWGFNLYGQLGYEDTKHRGDGTDEMGDNLLEVNLGFGFTATSTYIPTKNPTKPTEESVNLTSHLTSQTFDPTYSPSVSPSIPPTYSPSVSPSIPPTNAPTGSPTACLDYDKTYNSFDGNDTLLKFEMNDDMFFNAVSLETEWIKCIDDSMGNKDNCFIGCYEPDGCSNTRIETRENIKLYELRLNCSAKTSCQNAIVNVTENIEIGRVAIICSGKKACDSMIINVDSLTDSMDITLHCTETYACSNVLMHLNANNKEMNVNAYCLQLDSCKLLHVYTDHSEEINLNLFMFQHSEDVVIDFEWFKDEMVHCQHEGDHRYIRYDLDTLLDSDDILDLAEKEYDSRRLPCDDIKVEYKSKKDETLDRECQFEYIVNTYNLSKILNLKDPHYCFWMDINTLIKPQCKGNWNTDLTFHDHIFPLNLDIIPIGLDSLNDANTITQQTICEEHFVTANITQRSMENIDAIFELGLNEIIYVNELIHDLLDSPMTMLRNNIMFYDCNSSGLNMNPIKITTKFTIQSAYDIKDVKNLFSENSQFINSSRELISQLFGIKIILRLVPDTGEISKSYEKLLLRILIAISVLVVIIVSIAFYCYKKALDREEKYAINVRNPLVIPYCIGHYDDGYDEYIVDDLYYLSTDIYNVRRFCQEYNYEFGKYKDATNDHDWDGKAIHLRWTSDMLTEDLHFQAEKLESNLGSTTKAFDALLIIISSHGLEEGIITSDHKIISKEYIHRMFSVTRPLCRKIPRIFLFDCCAGVDERATTVHDEDNDKKEDDLKDEAIGKVVEHKNRTLSHAHVDSKRDQTWYRDEVNPDYRLVRLDAANVGYMAKISEEGSYMITHFIDKLMEEHRNKTFLYQIMDEIQSKLHDTGKQQIVPQYLNQTRYVRFVKNVKPKIDVEMQTKANIKDLTVPDSSGIDENDNKLKADNILFVESDDESK